MTLSAEDSAALQTPFVRSLISLIRANDTYGAWESKSDAALLTDFVVTKERRREIPIIGDPDPKVLWRVEMYYTAIGLAFEKATGAIASPLMKIGHEGFGRVLLTAGRLVVLSKSVRDVHRFGFDSLAKLAEQGGKLVEEAVATATRFPDVVAA